MYCQHPFEPVADPRARVLILGSFPSVRSRQEGFYYGHARNRFWQVLAQVYGRPVPGTIPEKKDRTSKVKLSDSRDSTADKTA